MNIPLDIILLIESFICIKSKKYNPKLISKKFNQNIKCKVVKYKDLIACKCHDDINLYNCINILKSNANKSNISTIHFDNLNSINYSKKYLSEFGNISHFCCEGKGVMFLDGRESTFGQITDE